MFFRELRPGFCTRATKYDIGTNNSIKQCATRLEKSDDSARWIAVDENKKCQQSTSGHRRARVGWHDICGSVLFFFPFLSFFLLHRPREIGKGFSLRDPKKRWIYGPIKRSLSLLFKEEHYSINEEMEFFPFFFSFFLMEILQDSSRRFWKIIKHQIHFETNFVIISWNIYIYFDFNF